MLILYALLCGVALTAWIWSLNWVLEHVPSDSYGAAAFFATFFIPPSIVVGVVATLAGGQ